MSEGLTVSVVIPVHNGLPFLPETLASVLGQTRPPDEVVVVENGSTDGTGEWLAALGDPRVRVVTQPELVSPAQNWTTAVQEASGDLVKLVCADDLLEPITLAEQAQALAEHPDAVLVAAWRRVIDHDGRVVVARRGLGPLRGEISGEVAIKSCALRGVNAFGEAATVLFRREELQAAMPWDDSLPYVIDLDLYSRVAAGRKVVMLPRVHASFRLSAGAWTRNLAGLQRDHFNRWVDRLVERGVLELSGPELVRARLMAAVQATARRAAYEYTLLASRLRRD
jgi:glycosyltransferase involved in cell wall biosynthesis